MLTLEYIKEHVLEEPYERETCELLDNRDLKRLIVFYPVSEYEDFGFELSKNATSIPEVVPYTREKVLEYLKNDLEFAFEKALAQRGISTQLLWEVIKMWMWVLEDELVHFSHYEYYGLPLFKAVAVKYGLNNPIGDDTGSEEKYSGKSW